MDMDKDQETQLQGIMGVDEKGLVSKKRELKIPKAESDEEGGVGVGNQYLCKECGKAFGSGKGLGGHKRVHSLNYKSYKKEAAEGVVDPPPAPAENNNIACCLCGKMFRSIKGLSGHMRNHPGRDWKGIKPPLQDPQFASSTSTVSDSSSVDLMGSLKGWPVTAKRCRSTCVASSSSSSGSEKVVEEEMQEAVDHLLIMASGPPKKIEGQVESFTGAEKKKKRRLADLNKEGEDLDLDHHNNINNQHVCITCNKSFSTYQALGGHRASHKVKAQVVEDSGTEGSSYDHQCNICSKRFQTGQALGGHKRCHWTATVEPPAPTVLPFDLNELPPPPDQSDDEC